MRLYRFVALDVEIARRSPIQICSLGVVRYEAGREVASFQSLVRVEGSVRFTEIHGLTRGDLAAAPTWKEAWASALAIVGDVSDVIAFRASFDRGALIAMSGREVVRLPRLRFICVAEMLRQRYGLEGSLSSALEKLGLTFPGRPHDPLADARAAAMAAVACWGDTGEEAHQRGAPIQFSKIP